MSPPLEGLSAIVTGAGRGLGRAEALELARLGAAVVVNDFGQPGRDGSGEASAGPAEQVAEEIRAAGGRALAHTGDVADFQQAGELVELAVAEFGTLDILVNNAGIGASGRFLDTSVETWDRVMAINVRGVMLGCRLFLPAMVARGKGHVVNTASMAGYFASPDLPVYAASKYAVLGFSESLRIDMAGHGIGVSAICPGIINTNIVATTVAEGESAKWQSSAVDFYKKRNYGPEKVASAILGAVRSNAAVVPVSPEAWFGWYLKRLLPGVARAMAGRPLPFQK